MLGGHRHVDGVGAVRQLTFTESRTPPAEIDRQPTSNDGRPSKEVVGVFIGDASADGASRGLLNDLVDVVMANAAPAEHRSQSSGNFGPDEFKIVGKHRATRAWNQGSARHPRLPEVPMASYPSGHRTLPRLVAGLLMVLGLAVGTLLATASPASATGKCVDVYQGGYGTTVCTP
jgi:hypothetical protein